MEQLVKKYADKLIRAKLGSSQGVSQPLVGGIDDILVWNRKADETNILKKVFRGLNINSLIFLRPEEPYGHIMNFLGQSALEKRAGHGIIHPKDCETKTFLHDLPVIDDFNADKIIKVLKKRKSVIIVPKKPHDNVKNHVALKKPAIIAHGTVSPEQCFVTISSVCFAGFVKFFTDYLYDIQTGEATKKAHDLFDLIIPYIQPLPEQLPQFAISSFNNESQIYAAVVEAGRKTIEYELVDSYFGNVSCYWNNTLYISQTGSCLDELEGCIDPVPLDGSSSAGLTASSELSAHIKIIEKTGCKTILHGHPKFSVIASMDCKPEEKAVCKFNKQCHIRCPKKRFAGTTPIVPGEVGTGPFGLCNTLPYALEQSDSAIVYGHGLFTIGKNNFSEAFNTMTKVENYCRNNYFETINSLRLR
ncbi:class II aldolase/adducin family protein [Desulfobacterales bacterium HSG17]|nr:class II aldolase/adducin family protein [Desulfobacterales bacterium HSG17]